jgi:hypothetical protein
MASTDHQEHFIGGITIFQATTLDKISELTNGGKDQRFREYLMGQTGAERQQRLTEKRIAEGKLRVAVWLSAADLEALKAKFPGPRGGVDWESVTKAALDKESGS